MFEKNFPILKRLFRGRRLVYLDNAATTQRPASVIDAVADFYRRHNANVHRGIYALSQEASEMYEGAREKVRKFIGAGRREEIIFTRGATEAINLVVWTWGHDNVRRGDEILLTEMEHHSNLVPWQILAKKKGAKLKFIPVVSPPPLSFPLKGEEFPSLEGRGKGRVSYGRLDLRNLNKLITKKTKIVSLCHVSNILGTINPVEKIIKAAHRRGALVLLDGAQAAGHMKVDVQKLDCDFYAFSGHKMYGPTGIGVLFGKKELLAAMSPYQTGGSMIGRVDWTESTWAELPDKFEAGTPAIAEAVGLGAAVDYLNKIGLKKLMNHELGIMNYGLKKLAAITGLTIYGPRDIKDRIGVLSFTLDDVPAHDLASILDERGVAIRVGHHCAMPLHKKFGINASARASLGIYNTKTDIDELVKGIEDARKLFR